MRRMSTQTHWILCILSILKLLCELPYVNAAKILIVVYPQPSHVIAKIGIGVNLIDQGHEVHIALPSGYPHKEALTRAGIQIVLHHQFPGVRYPFTIDYENTMNDLIYNRGLDEMDTTKLACHDICRSFMEDTDFIVRLRNENYSLLLVEPFGIFPCYLVVPHYLGVPFVSITASLIPFTIRSPALPTFYPTIHLGPEIRNFNTLQTLRERISNIGATFVMTMGKYVLWNDMTLLQRYAPGIESWEELMQRNEMFLVENDHLLDNFLPLFPHAVTVAGCSARPAPSLPESLEKIMAQSGDEGVILASFGTSAYRMPANIAVKFLDAFGRLKQKVLTKIAVPPGIQVHVADCLNVLLIGRHSPRQPSAQ